MERGAAAAARGARSLPRGPRAQEPPSHAGPAEEVVAARAAIAAAARRITLRSMQATIRLGVNVDHVATLRQARGTTYPDPLYAALVAEQSGADSITIHLREDRRHIQDRDVRLCQQALQTRLNLEMAATEAMVQIAVEVRPPDCCLVPERCAEVTTEGGLDVAGQEQLLQPICARLAAAGIRVSLFVDPEAAQLDAAIRVGAPVVELHTGAYAEAKAEAQARELERVRHAARYGARA